MADFEGGGAPGGDEIALRNSNAPLVFRGEVSINPTLGAALPGAGDGVTEVVYTVRDGNTWLLADVNDNGTLDASDFAVQFSGIKAFTEADFTTSTNFVTAGTNGDDTIVGTEDDDENLGLGGNDTVPVWAATTCSMVASATTCSMAALGGSITSSEVRATTRSPW